MSRHNRRDFLKSAAAAAWPPLPSPAPRPPAGCLGANDRVRIAVAGINGRGQEHLHEYLSMKATSRSPTWSIPTAACTHRAARSVKRRAGMRAQVRRRPAQGLGRQEPGRRLDRLAEPLALALGHLGHARRARTSTWRSLAATTSSRDASSWKRRASTTASSSTARRAAPTRDWAKEVAAVRSGKYGKLLISYGYASKTAPEHRLQATQGPAQGAELRHLARTGDQAALSREHRALQLALVLGLRQWRDRQPGRPPDGHRPLGIARWRRAPQRDQPGRPLRLQGSGPDAQYPVDHHRLRRRQDFL